MELGLIGGGVRKTSIVLATPFECSGIPFSMVSGFRATYIVVTNGRRRTFLLTKKAS